MGNTSSDEEQEQGKHGSKGPREYEEVIRWEVLKGQVPDSRIPLDKPMPLVGRLISFLKNIRSDSGQKEMMDSGTGSIVTFIGDDG